MEYNVLGKTGVKVSQICFGTMSFGGDADEETSATMFHRCLDAGINFFDCANVYAGGRSEEILGKLMASERDNLVITSKVASGIGQGINDSGLSRRHIMLQVERSLKRLNTDRIDLYFVHHFDHNTPIDETLRALDDLTSAGKILYPAASNWAAWQIAKALGVSATMGVARFECLQPMYSLAKRQAEVEILPLAQSEQLGVIPYSPLGAGLLTGKYSIQERPKQGRLVENTTYMKRYGDSMNYEVAEAFSKYARQKGVQAATLAVAWVMSHPAITAPIIGARNLEQLEGSLAALDLDMDPEWRREVSSLSPEPPPATDRAEERT